MPKPVHVVCPACNGVNRIPAERLGDSPACGSCREPLFTGEPVELSADSFNKHITRSDVPVVVDFWASWCAPCRMMAPEFAAASADLEPGVRLARLDTEAAPAIAGRLGIRSIPTIVLFAGGHERARQSGAMRRNDIVRWIRASAGAQAGSA